MIPLNPLNLRFVLISNFEPYILVLLFPLYYPFNYIMILFFFGKNFYETEKLRVAKKKAIFLWLQSFGKQNNDLVNDLISLFVDCHMRYIVKIPYLEF